MAMTALLQFGDNDAGYYFSEYDVVRFSCRFTRHHNCSQPDSDPLCDKISVTVVSPGMENHQLLDWYIKRECISGKMVLDISDIGGATSNEDKLELFFEDAVCFSMSDDYDVEQSRRREFTFEFFAAKVNVNKIDF